MRHDPCGGDGCEGCDGQGHTTITRCPLDYVTPDVVRAFNLIRWADRGAFPVGGGVLDQAGTFIAAMEFVRDEERKIEAAKRRSPFNRDAE